MVDAESKINSKRIRHLYPLKEIFHLFIHSDKYYYSPNNRHQISCKGNYLVIGDIGRKATIEDIEEMWYHNSNRMIAIIDRTYKRIMINEKYQYHVWRLKRAIPDDYIIYLTDETISSKDILNETEQCCRIHLKYMVKDFVEKELRPYYDMLYTRRQTIYNDCDYSNYWRYKEIVEFVNKYGIKKYDFYKECFNDKYKLRLGYSFCSQVKTIKLPTVKQIITNTVFNKKEKLLIEQKVFYTKYCYGKGIKFKDVVNNWNKEIPRNDVIKYLEKRLTVNPDWFTDEKTWNEYIIKTSLTNNQIEKKIFNDNIEKSVQNERDAIERLKELQNYSIDDWREGKTIPQFKVTYKKFIEPRNKHQSGKWIDYPVYSNRYTLFSNTVLRLSKDRKYIETSRNAKVPFNDGVRMYKFFNNIRSINKEDMYFTTSDFGNIKVGVYNLRYIKYKAKHTDDNKNLGYCEWLIQIGCHSLWLDDINEFIRYYHLEDTFGLNKTNNNNLNIEIKK